MYDSAHELYFMFWCGHFRDSKGEGGGGGGTLLDAKEYVYDEVRRYASERI